MKITPTHLPNTLLPLQDGLRVEALDADDEALTVTLTPRQQRPVVRYVRRPPRACIATITDSLPTSLGGP